MKHVSTKRLALGVAVVALLLAGVVSFYASGSPDGLERVAEDKGFSDTAKEHGAADSPFADYATRAVDNERLSGALAGIVGVVVVLALTGGLAYVVRRRRPGHPPAEADHEAGHEADHGRDHEPIG